ncbi:metabolite traffic protein EboE [Mariniblastus fucicola]|uniref:Xylose isomerase-like TIM barrel n=1 Tax=Mariniblastus fucicola TaxID=980251 RepID=A0A5B9P822_9BACT|nr:metabolite traffic protein EboE [Mariniblastus fucicola]QEG22827.1 hypothetical protein MFFC18_27120 [Mariniblastus fucicola]
MTLERKLKIGYCCNVHGGTTLDEVKANLQRYSCEVKQQVSPESTMPIGLWLSQSAISGLGNESQAHIDNTHSFADWLSERGLDPFTFNGFPLGDFHQEVVKHDVYLPTWAETSRLEYTKKLAVVQSMLLARADDTAAFQSISTLPLGWPPVHKSLLFDEGREFLKRCATNLHTLVEFLAELKAESGNHVAVCIEPEPGCVFDSCDEIVRYFEEYLFDCDSKLADRTREHLGICHDVCHSAVMFEDQKTAVEAYRNAGITIGKVQVSSAIKMNFEEDAVANQSKLNQLSQFSEPRYLHQTSIRGEDSSGRFYEDLSLAMGDQPGFNEEWRVHFHVPIFADRLGQIETTQAEIDSFLLAIQESGTDIEHFEVETYAWNVLPDEYREVSGDLASGIAAEMSWLLDRVQ